MEPYETVYLIIENTQLAGNAFMDTVSIIFALMVTGYVAGPRMPRRMIWGIVFISALFVLPMIDIVRGTLAQTAALRESLTDAQIKSLPQLEVFALANYPTEVGSLFMILSLMTLYAGAIYFVFHCHRIGSVTANS